MDDWKFYNLTLRYNSQLSTLGFSTPQQTQNPYVSIQPIMAFSAVISDIFIRNTMLAGQIFQHDVSSFLQELVHCLVLGLYHVQHWNVSATREKYFSLFIKEPVFGYHCNTKSYDLSWADRKIELHLKVELEDPSCGQHGRPLSWKEAEGRTCRCFSSPQETPRAWCC